MYTGCVYVWYMYACVYMYMWYVHASILCACVVYEHVCMVFMHVPAYSLCVCVHGCASVHTPTDFWPADLNIQLYPHKTLSALGPGESLGL